jgi:hypothetical protein
MNYGEILRILPSLVYSPALKMEAVLPPRKCLPNYMASRSRKQYYSEEETKAQNA